MEQTPKENSFRRAKLLATGLFVLVAVVFVACRLFRDRYGWIEPLEAFCEAAMVGALADWFAVTALFRKPLGIPWHTEIIPRKKDAIGRNLGTFIVENFLTRRIIYRRLRELDLSDRLGRWLQHPGNAALVADEISRFLSGFVEFASHEEVKRFFNRSVFSRERMERLNPARWAGMLLELMVSEGRMERVLDEALDFIRRSFEENKDIILDKINEKSYWFVPSFVDDKIFRDFVRMVDEFFDAIADDPTHEVRLRFSASMRTLAARLMESDEYRQRAGEVFSGLMDNDAAREFVESAWSDLKGRTLESLNNSGSTLRRDMERFIVHTAGKLIEDEAMRRALNRLLIRVLLYLSGQYRSAIASFVAVQMSGWGANELTEKLESHVGADLQFIRVNGTIIGGLAGLGIYMATKFF